MVAAGLAPPREERGTRLWAHRRVSASEEEHVFTRTRPACPLVLVLDSWCLGLCVGLRVARCSLLLPTVLNVALLPLRPAASALLLRLLLLLLTCCNPGPWVKRTLTKYTHTDQAETAGSRSPASSASRSTDHRPQSRGGRRGSEWRGVELEMCGGGLL